MEVYASAIVNLHLTDEQFWRTTPAIVHALLKQVQYNREFVQFQTGIIASTIINMIKGFAGSHTDPVDPKSYIPRFSSYKEDNSSSSDSARQEKSEDQKLKESLEFIRSLNTSFGGIDLRQLESK